MKPLIFYDFFSNEFYTHIIVYIIVHITHMRYCYIHVQIFYHNDLIIYIYISYVCVI